MLKTFFKTKLFPNHLNLFFMQLNPKLFDLFANTTKRYGTMQAKKDTGERGIVRSSPMIEPSQVLSVLKHKGVDTNDFISNDLTRERILKGNDLVPLSYFHMGLKRARAVGRVTINSPMGSGYGTGFLIAPNLLMTNNHVLESAEDAANSFVEFDYELDEENRPRTATSFSFLPQKLFVTSPDLDFTIVFVQEDSLSGGRKLSEFGIVPSIEQRGKLMQGNHVSIVQHPSGNRKSIALRNNMVTNLLDHFIHYETDTEPGSSGSPVFNDVWELVALHHSGVPRTDEQGRVLTKDGRVATNADDERDIDWIANEGVRLSSIIAFLKTADLSPEAQMMLKSIVGEIETPTPASDTTADSTAKKPKKKPKAPSKDYYNHDDHKDDIATYYKGVNLSDNKLYDPLSNLLQETHDSPLSYKPSQYLYPEVDVRENGKIISIYSGKESDPETFIMNDEKIDAERKAQFLLLSKNEGLMAWEDYTLKLTEIEENLPYNCEHVVPQSWFSKQSPMRGDLHHLFACEIKCNSYRGNIPYTDFADYKPELEAQGVRNECGKLEGNGFEPEFNKGIVARATLYYLMRYPKKQSNRYDKKRVETLLEWHKAQPVSDFERRRNSKIQELQGNRNPLIDFPELAEKIDFSRGL